MSDKFLLSKAHGGPTRYSGTLNPDFKAFLDSTLSRGTPFSSQWTAVFLRAITLDPSALSGDTNSTMLESTPARFARSSAAPSDISPDFFYNVSY